MVTQKKSPYTRRNSTGAKWRVSRGIIDDLKSPCATKGQKAVNREVMNSLLRMHFLLDFAQKKHFLLTHRRTSLRRRNLPRDHRVSSTLQPSPVLHGACAESVTCRDIFECP